MKFHFSPFPDALGTTRSAFQIPFQMLKGKRPTCPSSRRNILPFAAILPFIQCFSPSNYLPFRQASRFSESSTYLLLKSAFKKPSGEEERTGLLEERIGDAG